MKQPVSITPITVPSVGTTSSDTGRTEIIDVYVGGLITSGGPQAFQGRHAIMIMSLSQAECLLMDLAAKLGMTVS